MGKRFFIALLWSIWLPGCALLQGSQGASTALFSQNDLPACQCLLVLPLADLSEGSLLGAPASRQLAAQLNQGDGLRAFDHQFVATLLPGLEAADLALAERELSFELADLLGADAILSGTISGTWQRARVSEGRLLWVEMRLLSTKTREVLWAKSVGLRPTAGNANPKVALESWLVAIASKLQAIIPKAHPTAQSSCLSPNSQAQMLATVERAGVATAAKPPEPPEPLKTEATPAAQVDDFAAQDPSEPLATPPPAPAPPDVPSESTAATPSSAKPAMTPAAVALLIRMKRGSRVPLETVSFDEGQSTITELGGETLDQLAMILAAKPEIKLSLEVHVDAGRNPALDRRLTEQQAEELIKTLSERWKIDIARLEGVGRGSEQPVQPNITRRGREANRRVEARLQEL